MKWTAFDYSGELGEFEADDRDEAMDIAEDRWPNAWPSVHVQHEDWEPDDYDIYNGPGMEGGVRYVGL